MSLVSNVVSAGALLTPANIVATAITAIANRLPKISMMLELPLIFKWTIWPYLLIRRTTKRFQLMLRGNTRGRISSGWSSPARLARVCVEGRGENETCSALSPLYTRCCDVNGSYVCKASLQQQARAGVFSPSFFLSSPLVNLAHGFPRRFIV